MTFEAALKTVQSLTSGQLPPFVAAGAVMLVVGLALLTTVRQYLTGDRPPNLLTPNEHRVRQKLAAIHDLLERTPESWTHDLLKDEEERLQFLLITGINAKATLRRQLWTLHQAGPLRFSWKELRVALPFLRVRDGQLVRGIDRIDLVMLWLVKGLTILCMLLAGLLIGVSLVVVKRWIDMLPMVALEGVLVFMAVFLTTLGLPVARAVQFQRFLTAEQDPPEPETMSETSTSPGERIRQHAGARPRARD